MQGIGNTRFARPVTIKLRKNSRDQIVADASHAARVLMHEWPSGDSAKRQAAVDACLRVLRGDAYPPIARGAFVAAALEARILASD